MKCEDYQSIIEEYIDSELDRKTADRVNEHLAVCRECVDFCEEIRREQTVYANYRREVEVTPALWAAVQQRIEAEKGAPESNWLARLRERFSSALATPRFSPALAAALVIVTIGVTAAVMSYLHSNQTDKTTQVAAGNNNDNKNEAPDANKNSGEKDDSQGDGKQLAKDDATPDSETDESDTVAPRRRPAVKRPPTPEQLIKEAEQKYVSAIAILSRDVNRNRSQIDPMTLARFDAALDDIDYTIAETRKAVRQNPNDPIALQYMLAAYAKKVDVLREMARD